VFVVFCAALICSNACGNPPYQVLPQCGPGVKNDEIQIIDAGLGSRISASGKISDSNLNFTFKKYKKAGISKDLFNYIYFEGDTICFSFLLSGEVDKKNVDVCFIDPHTGKNYSAERVDLYKNRVSGFSLAGSILEKFNSDSLNRRIPKNMYCCNDIPFQVRIIIKHGNSDIQSIITGAFRIEYE
jgi:hypothetical protein